VGQPNDPRKGRGELKRFLAQLKIVLRTGGLSEHIKVLTSRASLL
jgi:hypothetical protein